MTQCLQTERLQTDGSNASDFLPLLNSISHFRTKGRVSRGRSWLETLSVGVGSGEWGVGYRVQGVGCRV
ncbi:MAG: hypothetical protein KME27_12935 [Lyngbya sp. HA4199-MV5]|nr:hypothetical protein [Lyngbya sp. HA4199-MV5]